MKKKMKKFVLLACILEVFFKFDMWPPLHGSVNFVPFRWDTTELHMPENRYFILSIYSWSIFLECSIVS